MRRVLTLVHPDAPEALEEVIGAAEGPGGAFSPGRLAELDAAEEFPTEACRLLDDFGLPRYYVPARYGGLFTSHLELLRLLRAVARRDLTVAVAHGKTYLGSVPVWVAGRPAKAGWLAGQVINCAVVAWALTERAHGSDLLGGEVRGERTRGGWRLTGTKELINNATRAGVVCTLARTAPDGGPRGFSLFLVDKHKLPPASFHCLPKERTHGVRGADISGIAFDGAVVPARSVIGAPGQGFEVVVKSLQLTRIFATGLSLGAADHALRLAVRFVRQRHLYGRDLVELPRIRRVIGEVAAARLLAEAACALAGRGAHTLTGELSVVSAVVKAFVPTIVQRAIDSVAELLGSRGFLTGVFADGAFAKLDRDHRIVGIFDGSTMVNRAALIEQFPKLARCFAAGTWDSAGVAAAASLTAPLGEVDPGALTLLSRQGCGVVQSLPQSLRRVRSEVAGAAAPAQVAELVEALVQRAGDLHRNLASALGNGRQAPASAYRLAERYELCFAGAASLLLWLHNMPSREEARPLWRDALWLRACLARVLIELDGDGPAELVDRLADAVLDADDPADGQDFSLFADPTGAGPATRRRP